MFLTFVKPCLNNIPFCITRHVCMILENENVKYMKLKELRRILKTLNYPKAVVENGIEKLSQFPRSNLEVKN